jgi:asparagine synthase (glutamine-hydrolysing)
VERELLESMSRQIVHRGPDDTGFYLDNNVGLAMRRLSIVDLRTGHQPISNEDGNIWIVYNGEIYNHDELRKRLEELGHRYRTRSDTETILHAYEQYGSDCVKHLRGMFAFVVWDGRHRTIFAARDRLGIKPFYYRISSEHFLFASEIKALLAHPEARAELNRDVLPEYLTFGYTSGPETLFTAFRKLPPGCTLEVTESGDFKVSRYWHVPQGSETSAHPRQFYVQTYREKLEEAVRIHLMSDVPLGVFLSGGLDSSAVAALMTKIRREPIETFSVGYTEEEFSELKYARIVAKHLNSNHHEVQVSREDFFQALPRLIWQEDEPLAWPASIPLYFVSRLAGEHVKVVLTGEGSDETLAGYARYMWTLWNARFDRAYRALTLPFMRQWIRETFASNSSLSASVRRKFEHTFLGRDGSSWTSLYFDNFYAAFSGDDQKSLFQEDGWDPLAPYRQSLNSWEESKGDLLARMLQTDIQTYLVELCMKQDQMSMAASIESRVPFLDHELVEFACSIPSRFKTRGLEGKRILKEGVKDILPPEIVYRKKMGFPTPLARWLLGPQLDFIESMLLSPRARRRGLFNMDTVKRICIEHRSGRRDHSDQIWRLLNLELWQRIFIDRQAPSDCRLDPLVDAEGHMPSLAGHA